MKFRVGLAVAPLYGNCRNCILRSISAYFSWKRTSFAVHSLCGLPTFLLFMMIVVP